MPSPIFKQEVTEYEAEEVGEVEDVGDVVEEEKVQYTSLPNQINRNMGSYYVQKKYTKRIDDTNTVLN